jgi:hypothetical protein
MIDSKKDEIMSSLVENMDYIKLIQDDQQAFKYRLDTISMEEGKQREAVQKTILHHVATLQTEMRD